MSKTKKITKKTQKKQIKPVKDTYLSHFHAGNRLGLTICSKQVPGTDIYCLGMSLVHKDDMGSREFGRARAVTRCISGLDEFAKNQEFFKTYIPPKPSKGIVGWFKALFADEQPVKQNLLTDVTAAGIIGQSGHWLIKGLDDTKELVKFLRNSESLLNASSNERMLDDLYHQVFFRLPTVVLPSASQEY